MALENLFSNLLIFGSRQTFALVFPDLCIPRVPHEVLQRVLSQASMHRV